jgi:uncharacterized protein
MRSGTPISNRLAVTTALFAVALLFTIFLAHAGELRVIDAGGALQVPHIVSLKELRFKSTIRQEHDFSCGSAALATLLTFHYGAPVTEEEVFKAMFENGDKKKIEKEGFSLLDMKRYLVANGFRADGYITHLDKVARVGIPAIVLINNGGYLHFVVVKGIDEEKVLIGDPATGARTLPRSEFEAIWNKLVFVIHGNKQIAKSSFNQAMDWKVREKSPLGAALSGDGLGAYSLFLPPGFGNGQIGDF